MSMIGAEAPAVIGPFGELSLQKLIKSFYTSCANRSLNSSKVHKLQVIFPNPKIRILSFFQLLKMVQLCLDETDFEEGVNPKHAFFLFSFPA
jgi:hypothetical protein